MHFPRESGILLHPTSLPGRFGIGEFGKEAYAFVDALVEMKQSLWQVLPLGPTGYGDSPYQSFSTFAGNPLLISFDMLHEEGLLTKRQLDQAPTFPEGPVDYGTIIPARLKVLTSACRGFSSRASAEMKREYAEYCEANREWLDDYALFTALKERHNSEPFTTWSKALIHREPDAMKKARAENKTAIRNVRILQYLFHRQWQRLRSYCHGKGIRIVGDIPIFVAHDSADVWAHPELYYLDEDGNPTVIAGVPPDYFSATGQRWGNPLYRWEVHAASDYHWWKRRLRKAFEMVDVLRIDHFRGFEAYWEIDADEPTAINGKWVKGPGHAFFDSLLKEFGDLPIIAEDLGVITDEVEALRDDFQLPGMRVLQFAFGTDPKATDYRPESFPPNCVCYTGTHDNDTTVGWFWSEAGEGSTRTQAEIEAERVTILGYTHTDGSQIHWDLIALGMKSGASTFVAPMQDVLGLGSEHRMNVPGTTGGNWRWRLSFEWLTPEIRQRLASIAEWSGRDRSEMYRPLL